MSENTNTYTNESEIFLPGNILLVDDEALIRKTLQRFFVKSGYTVDTAENGIEALQKLETTTYDLVITDLKMPGLDGRELLKAMAQRFGNIPRIVLTAIGSNEDILLALKTGAYDFISKPIVDFAFLNYTIQRALERKKLADDRILALAQLEKVNDLLSLINRGLDSEEIFKMLNVSLRSIIPFNRIFLIKDNQANSVYEIRLAASDLKMITHPHHEIPYDSSALDTFRNSSEDVFIINDIAGMFANVNLPPEIMSIGGEVMNSAITLSLKISGKRWGYLMLISELPSVYKDEHVSFLRLVAGQISLGIQRGELLAELEVHTKHLEQLVKVRTYEVLKTQKTTIFALSRLAETRDNETGDHLYRMRSYCILLAQLLKYSGIYGKIENQYLRDIYDSSILHDIGKVGIPDQILRKPGPLTPEEFEIMKTHTLIGYNAINDPSQDLGTDSFLDMAKDIILYHHERWDGMGYPKKLKEDEIPLSARIVSISDVYDALTTRRPYKEPFSHEDTLEIMIKEVGKYDPVLFKLFNDNNADFDRIRRQYI
ncbi:MAG TPA: response regulator [Spirochaetota bacterium]|nr:response regulator [Spirochaetota bacterium]